MSAAATLPGAARGVAEEGAHYDAGPETDALPRAEADARPARTDAFPEATLTALWLLGRVPAAAFAGLAGDPRARIVSVVRPGRAGRGPGPDVRESTLLLSSGVTRTGDVEVHLRAGDFARHGHLDDPAYSGVVLHLCWEDDRPLDAAGPAGMRGGATPLSSYRVPSHRGQTGAAGEHAAPTLALAPLLRDPARVEALVARGPSGLEPCAGATSRLAGAPIEGGTGGPGDPGDPEGRDGRDGSTALARLVRVEGRKRLAERAWRAWRLADRTGFDGALAMLLERALASTAGRAREDAVRRGALAAAVLGGLAPDPVAALAAIARSSDPRALAAAMRVAAAGRDVQGGPRIGEGRALEVAWNAALPLLMALAAAYDDAALARATAEMASRWPAPRPYGRTRALAAQVEGRGRGDAPVSTGAQRRGALYAQGLLHLQDLWCSRGGCGACPLSPPVETDAAR